MVRWIGLALLATVAWAGSFEKVPVSSPEYQDLADVVRVGLAGGSLVKYTPGRELTRFEFALLWNSAYESLRAQASRSLTTVTTPDRHVTTVVSAMTQLLGTFKSEISTLGTDPAEAAALLSEVPRKLAVLGTTRRNLAPLPRPTVAPSTTVSSTIRPGLFAPLLGITADTGSLGLTATLGDGPGLDTTSTEFGGRFKTGLFGRSEAGLSIAETQVLEYDRYGPNKLMDGYVLGADLRLRLGDDSVVLEYYRSLAQRYVDDWSDVAGQGYKASYLRQLGNSLKLDVGYSRMSSGLTLLKSPFVGELSPDLHGVEAGLEWNRDGFGIESRAAVYQPADEPTGYINQLGTGMRIGPYRQLQLSLFYQTTNRKRLVNLADAWDNLLEARLVYGVADWLHADFGYRYEVSERQGSRADNEHVLGASLGLDF